MLCSWRASAVSLLAAVLWACPPSQPPPEPRPLPTPPAPPASVEPGSAGGDSGVTGPFTPAGDADVKALVAGQDGFAAALYGELGKAQGGNFAAAPASISLALSMTYAGARGETAAEMKQVLRFSTGGDATHRAAGTLLRAWAPQKDAQHELVIASRLFGARQITFSAGFLGVTQDHYQAPLEALDFLAQAEAARQHINGWVSEQTKERIEDLLPEGSIKPSAALVLTNAIYFNGTWVEKFDEKKTSPQAFHAAAGAVQAPMMRADKRFRYAEADGVKLVTLPYRGTTIAMTLVLPLAKDGLATAEQGFREGKLGAWYAAGNVTMVKLALPRFRIAGSTLSLRAALSALGMPSAFDERRADFGGMAQGSEPKLFLGDVFHKTFVDVHERGTEAAAATGVVMYPVSAPPPTEPKEFIADHPFLFFIHDTDRGGILFMGRVADPTRGA